MPGKPAIYKLILTTFKNFQKSQKMTDFVTNICGALEKTGSNNNKDIQEGMKYLQEVSFT